LSSVAYFFDVAKHVAGVEELGQDDGCVGDAGEHRLGRANVFPHATELRAQLQITYLHTIPLSRREATALRPLTPRLPSSLSSYKKTS
jgi:hypothetical protein